MRVRPGGRRTGFTLVELLVGLVIVGIIGAAMLRLMLSQNRFYDRQTQQREARSVARASLNYMLSEVRMLETNGGVADADASRVSLRVPYAFGLVCGHAAGGTVVSLLPVDSSAFAAAAPSGTAWRQGGGGGSGAYSYVETVPSLVNGGASVCAAAGIITLPGASVVTVSPELTGAESGTPMFLFQRVTYAFAPSAMAPGRVGLWRTQETSGATEELAAPFSATSHFQFFRAGRDTSDVVVPPLSEIRGLELVLDGESMRPGQGRASPERARLRAGVFFANVTS